MDEPSNYPEPNDPQPEGDGPPSLFVLLMPDGGVVIAERVGYVPPAGPPAQNGEPDMLDPIRELGRNITRGSEIVAAPFNAELDKSGFGVLIQAASSKSRPV